MKLLRLLCGVTLVSALFVSTTAAEDTTQQVVKLNREGMEAYTNLELAKSKSTLLKAVKLAQKGKLKGSVLARTYANLGVLFVGGFGDNAQGMDYFVKALKVDPKTKLDPLTSSPDVQSVFDLARAKAGLAPSAPRASRGAPPVNDVSGATGAGIALAHQAVPEQLLRTGVPVYIEMPPGMHAGQVYLFYKGAAMADYVRMEMLRTQLGWEQEIPCSSVDEPTMQYYILAFGPDGTPLGYAGSATSPYNVQIVRERNLPPPALPGKAPPEFCGSKEQECPPGIASCGGSDDSAARGMAGYDEACEETVDCQSGLICSDERCVFGEDVEESDVEDPDAPRFFTHLGVTLGAAYVGTGMRADRPIPSDPAEAEQAATGWINEGEAGCSSGGGGPCVRVQTPGFVPSFALRGTVGYYIFRRLALAAFLRMQLDRGVSQLSGILFGGRLQYLLTNPTSTGLDAALLLGGGMGQISVGPTQQGEAPSNGWPYVISGLGDIHAGAVFTYRFIRNLGVHITPEVHMLFPRFMLNVDLSAGVELAF